MCVSTRERSSQAGETCGQALDLHEYQINQLAMSRLVREYKYAEKALSGNEQNGPLSTDDLHRGKNLIGTILCRTAF